MSRISLAVSVICFLVCAISAFPGYQEEDTWDETIPQKRSGGCPFGSSEKSCRQEKSFVDAGNPPLTPSVYTTDKGCKCKDACGTHFGTHISSLWDYGRCDWCHTEGQCGQGNFVTGFWDYCKYSPVQSFEAQAHEAKASQLWGRLTQEGVVGKSGPVKSTLQVLGQVTTESMITTFDDQWEVMPAGRTKVIHSQGVHCQFELKVSDNSYTGLLAQGNQAGIIRMGAAQNLDGGVMFPGIGVKFLRTGQKSANFVALRSTGPGGSMNFFADKLTNHVAPPAALVKIHKFDQASGCTTMVGLSDVASYSQSGEKVSSPLFPFELEFEPSQEAQATMTDEKQTNDSLLNSLANIKPGTKLFDVYAVGSPSEAKQGTKKLLGTLTTTSECVRSTFGDEHMYFRHQRMEEDFAIRTEWIEQMKELSDTPAGSICKATTGPISKWQCPQGH